VRKTTFYKENDFQDSIIGKYPKAWAIARIEEKFDTSSGGTPDRQRKEYYKGSIPWVKSGELKDKVILETEEKITEEGLKNSAAKLFPKGTLLVAMYGATVGKTGILGIDATTNQAVCALLPKDKDVDIKYFKHSLMSIRNRWIFQSAGGAQPNISQEIIRSSRIPFPPYKEQSQIEEVLGVVDSALELADQIIAKTERLKRGLMQQLLTHGIGHTEYKQTPIGTIPKNWDVGKLGNLAELRGNRSINNLEKVAFIPMELVPYQQIFAKYKVRAREDVKSSTYCEAGDLLLAKITPSLENGKQGIVPLDVPNGVALATTEVFPLKCTGIDKFFLFYVLKHSRFRNQIIASMIGTTGRQRASKESVERLEIPVPPHNEQQRIAEVFFEVDKKLDLEVAEKERLERIKQGLMDLLLTGKVRIKVY